MKMTFNALCDSYLKEDGNTGISNPVSSSNTNNPAYKGSTAPATPTASTTTPTQQTQDQQKPATTQPQQPAKPDDILKTLTQLKDHPEFVKVIGTAIDQLNKNQQQKAYIDQTSNATSQQA